VRSLGVSEIYRHVEAFFGGPILIDSEMQVRQSLCVAGVAACRNRLPLRDTISDLYKSASFRASLIGFFILEIRDNIMQPGVNLVV